MNLTTARNELSVKGKNGIGFLLSAIIIWTIISILFSLSIEIQQKNMFMLFSTGLMFPLAVALSTLIKADWQLKNNPLGNLGLYLNLAQLIYFPIIVIGMVNSPEDAIALFAIITGAHFFPYGWFYRAKAYYVMAPVISVAIMLISFMLDGTNLWVIPVSFIAFLLCLIIWLTVDYKQKSKG
ncbi:hypothetical protein SH601_14435 [Gracilibacillus sp. S3-1-1]|uniref:Uncharacterized protein n=1 Tax=Gracilibacillus pellucidus TaxID=3095368 RepID=A0ACC6M8J7_9BACI|nr:hypothetical protein [Gracilibacillus sp. S3-1-1]MDX8047186.1 hypothetical protein [Gracilibacillus sp. S3-1-1]